MHPPYGVVPIAGMGRLCSSGVLLFLLSLAPLWAANKTKEQSDDLSKDAGHQLQAETNNQSISVTYSSSPVENYSAVCKIMSGSNTVCTGDARFGYVLGRRHIDVPRQQLERYVECTLVAQLETAGQQAFIASSAGLPQRPGLHCC